MWSLVPRQETVCPLYLLSCKHGQGQDQPSDRSKEACGYCCLVTKSCLTLCNPTDCSLPGSSVRGISQARVLEWVSVSSSRGSSRPKDQTHLSYISCITRRVLYHVVPPGKPPLGSETLRFLSLGMIPSVAKVSLYRDKHMPPSSVF